MKINTSTLTGPALDYAAAIADGRDYWRIDVTPKRWTQDAFTPSTDWAQGGPIIEREGLTVGRQVHKTEWSAEAFDGSGMSMTFLRFGPTPLVAAMRCYVTSKLGDTVEIPDELC